MDAPLPSSAVGTSHDAIITPVLTVGPQFRIWAGALAGVVAWALFAWIWQLRHGLGVTNLGRPVYWGLYITNFVFFIGVSHAGTLISAILRIVQAEWRRPITRMAEVITVLVLFFGVGNVILDLGRPDRALAVLLHPHFRSPLLWDVGSISVYLTCSTVYLYLPLIPDIALLRDRTSGWRHRFYKRLAIGWTGAPHQWHRLERTISIMAIGVIPVAISVHTVVSWVFAMTIQPMWHSSIFGPYFVVGAIFSGIAAIITAMVVVRKVYGLERYLQPIHFNNLGLLLLVMACLWLYFTFAEHLTIWYAQEPNELGVFNAKLFGHFAPLFWAMLVFCFVVPFTILANNRTRTITGTLVASISVNIGMWLERFTIVVPTLSNPRAPVHTFLYSPSWVEWSLMAGCFAAFALLYMGFTKLFPIVSIWELPPDLPPAPVVDTPRSVAIARALAPGGHPTRTVPGLARITLGVVLILAAVPGRAWAQEPSVVLTVALPDRPTAGARVFLQKGCGHCHSLGAQAAARTMVGPDLRQLLVSRTVMDLAGAFWNHAPVMREKMQELKLTPPTLTRDDIADIFVLLTAYRYYEVELGRPGNATSGRRVFVDKGCAGCHDEDLKTGTRVGPGLQKYRGRSSAIFVAQAMWNHGAEMANAMRTRSVPWPKFAPREMDDLIAYLQGGAGAPDRIQYFDSGSPRRGREIFAGKQCITCHAVHGKGGRGGPDLGARTGDLVASVATIASVMWNHSPPMAAEFERRGIRRITFSGQEMVDVIAYLYFVNYSTVRAVPARGAKLFADKCATCHSKQAGRGAAPDLTTKALFDEPLALTAAMWNHGPMMSREVETRGLSWPRLERGEAADLAAFLLSRRTGGPVPDGPR
jgi:Ni/Fe-hydrogenase subunit HybB-like protein/mono/diheme cytochrome c family protein